MFSKMIQNKMMSSQGLSTKYPKLTKENPKKKSTPESSGSEILFFRSFKTKKPNYSAADGALPPLFRRLLLSVETSTRPEPNPSGEGVATDFRPCRPDTGTINL